VNKTIKILYITSTLSRTGPTNQLYNLVKYLDRKRFDPHVVTLSEESNQTRIHDFAKLGVSLHSIALSRLKGIILSRKRLGEIIRSVNPDIIHSQGIRADFLSSTLTTLPLRFATQHNYPPYDYPLKFGYFLGKLMAFSHIRILKKIPFVIACSKSISLLNNRHDLSVDFVQNGVDIEEFPPVSSDIEKIKLRKKLSIESDDLVFITVGSLIKRKAVDQLIKAYMAAEIPSKKSKLLILGEGPNRSEYQLLAKHFPNIYFVGQVSNVNDYLSVSDCFVSSSLAEGLPYTVIEAMGTGLPVILSDIGSHKEILEINPLAGDR